jgi:predicted Fe-Mo cluster-binding NifX family protein
MKIAIPVSYGQLSAHFGHCEQFALVEVDPSEKKIIGTEYAVPPPHEPGVLPRWLHEQGVDVIIAGGMGQRAQPLFGQNGIGVVVGARCQPAEETVADYLYGGIVSLLLDGVMTNCLFAHGCTGVTARMELVFRRPVQSGSPATLRAGIERASQPVYCLKAQLLQDGQVKATANGAFMNRSDLNS